MSTQVFQIGTNWELIHDSTVDGTFTGFLQKVSGNNTVFCFIGDTAPLITEKGFSAIEASLDLTVLSANNEKLWVRASAYEAILSLNFVAVPSASGGGSTEAAQDIGNASLDSIDTKQDTIIGHLADIDTILTDGEINVVLFDLGGAATEAKQDTGNTSLASINSKTPALATGAMPVMARDYRQDVARGLIAGESVVVIKGFNAATSTTNEPIWAQSGALYPLITSATTLTISSSSANDTLAGTGAQIVLVKYVRFSDLVEVTATFNMNGQTGVTITTDGYAINEIRVVQVGATNSNVGVIYTGYGTITAGVPANILATVVATAIVSQVAVYTVPATKTLELVSYRISPTVLSVIQFRLKPSKLSAMLTTEYDIPLAQAISFESPYPSPIPSGYQIQMWGRTTAGAGQLGLIIQGELRG